MLTTTVGKQAAIIVPSVHLNGTSQSALLEQLTTAGNALADALCALHDAAPHGRDYYTQGADAFTRATAEHRARVDKLVDVRNEILAIAEAVANQQARARTTPTVGVGRTTNALDAHERQILQTIERHIADGDLATALALLLDRFYDSPATRDAWQLSREFVQLSSGPLGDFMLTPVAEAMIEQRRQQGFRNASE